MKLDYHQTKITILEKYASCWNSLKLTKIQPYLDENVAYISIWVLETINGKHNFLKYFNGKLNTLKKEKSNTQIEAKLFMSSVFTSHVLEPCLVITQRFDNGNEQKVSLFIEVENELITRINLCDMNYHFFEFKPC